MPVGTRGHRDTGTPGRGDTGTPGDIRRRGHGDYIGTRGHGDIRTRGHARVPRPPGSRGDTRWPRRAHAGTAGAAAQSQNDSGKPRSANLP